MLLLDVNVRVHALHRRRPKNSGFHITMRHHTFALAILLTLFALVRATEALFMTRTTVTTDSSAQRPPTDPESLLARAEKLPFPCLNLAELELIPGISDTLGSAMLRGRSKVVGEYQRTHNYSALTLIEGVGDKRAQTLSSFLDLNQHECPVQ